MFVISEIITFGLSKRYLSAVNLLGMKLDFDFSYWTWQVIMFETRQSTVTLWTKFLTISLDLAYFAFFSVTPIKLCFC